MSIELFKVKKYPKTRNVLNIFERDSKTQGHGKREKVMEKVMEFEELKGVRTLLHSRIYLFGVSLLKDNIPTCVPKPVTCFITWETIANNGRIK